MAQLGQSMIIDMSDDEKLLCGLSVDTSARLLLLLLLLLRLQYNRLGRGAPCRSCCVNSCVHVSNARSTSQSVRLQD